jgi:hypothetical protein
MKRLLADKDVTLVQAADNLELKSDNLELKTQLSESYSVGHKRSRYQQAKIRFGCVHSCMTKQAAKILRDAEVERLAEGSAQERVRKPIRLVKYCLILKRYEVYHTHFVCPTTCLRF